MPLPERIEFESLPGRLLLDTCILNALQDYGEYVFDNCVPEGQTEAGIPADIRALRKIFFVNQRAHFQFVVSPLTIGELAAIRDFAEREARVRWAMDVLDHWHITLWEAEDSTVRQRRTLTPELSLLEKQLLEINDLRRNPYDRLILLESRLANCDAFLTMDYRTILRHKEALLRVDITVISPQDYWSMIEPWSALWC